MPFLSISFHIQILRPMNVTIVSERRSMHSHCDVEMENVLVNLSPLAVGVLTRLIQLINGDQLSAGPEDEKERKSSLALFDPKPFEDIDTLEGTTGIALHHRLIPIDHCPSADHRSEEVCLPLCISIFTLVGCRRLLVDDPSETDRNEM